MTSVAGMSQATISHHTTYYTLPPHIYQSLCLQFVRRAVIIL